MRDCHLKHTRDRVVATRVLMPRLIPQGFRYTCMYA